MTPADGLQSGKEHRPAGDRKRTPLPAIPRRRFRDEVQLSLIGFGGILVVGLEQRDADTLVAEAIDLGVNYFDVAPSYWNGEAEEKLGRALGPFREGTFLACKTLCRDALGARRELERSLRRLRRERLDLYQFHAVVTSEEVEQIFADGGAAETFVRAREEGKVRYIGFSAHSEEAALAMMERFTFDSVLFPVNFACIALGEFGPRVLAEARRRNVARLALKAMALSPWPSEAKHPYPKCWYRPISDPERARTALRFTLSQDITAALPPGETDLYRVALDCAADFTPLSPAERDRLLEGTKDITPLFQA